MNNYKLFQIYITLFVALVYLVDTLKPYIFTDLYNFLTRWGNTFIGIYYLYLTYELYSKFSKNK
jgi:hypothetical protein